VLEKSHLTAVRIDAMGGLWAFISNRLVFWLDENVGRLRILPPFATVLGTMGLMVGFMIEN